MAFLGCDSIDVTNTNHGTGHKIKSKMKLDVNS